MNEDFPFAGVTIRQDTPIGRLLRRWRSEPQPGHAVQALRMDLYSACLEEMRELAVENVHYDPAKDNRVTWGHQFIEVTAGKRRAIEPGVADVVDFLFGDLKPEISHQHRAANDVR